MIDFAPLLYVAFLMQLQSVNTIFIRTMLVCILAFSPLIGYGQEENPKDNDTGVSLLGFVDIEFCDLGADDVESNTNGITYTLEKWAARSLCYNLTNSSKSPIAVKTHFVDGAITIDSTRKRSCKSNEFVDKFGQYVSKYDKLVTIPPRSSVKQQATLRLPDDYVGHLLWCLAVEVFVPNAQQKPTWLFDIVLRKAKFIDAIVDGQLEAGFSVGVPSGFDQTTNLLSAPPFFLRPVDSGKLLLSLWLNNTGQVDQQTTTTIRLHWILWREIMQQTKEMRVEAWGKQDVQFEIPSFPWYKWLMSISASVDHTPSYNFESEFVTEDMKQKQTIKLEPVRYTPTAKRVSIGRWLIAIIFVLFVVIIWRHKKRQKNWMNSFPQNMMFPWNTAWAFGPSWFQQSFADSQVPPDSHQPQSAWGWNQPTFLGQNQLQWWQNMHNSVDSLGPANQ